MSQPGRYSITVHPGTTFRTRFARYVGDELIPPEGSRWKITIRDAQRLQLFAWDLAVIGEQVEIHLPPTITSQLKGHRHYYYVVDRIEPNGDVFRVLEGRLIPDPFGGANG